MKMNRMLAVAALATGVVPLGCNREPANAMADMQAQMASMQTMMNEMHGMMMSMHGGTMGTMGQGMQGMQGMQGTAMGADSAACPCQQAPAAAPND